MTGQQRGRRLVIVGGTWETQWGMLGPIVSEVKESWPAIWLDYPASYATPEAYVDSEDRGVTALILALRHSVPLDTDLAVLGFSQGAAIVEKALRQMQATGTIVNLAVLRRIRYVGLCGNPYRAPGDQIGPDPGGFGVIGPLDAPGHHPLTARGRWENFALPGDLISSCGADSLVRAIYPFTRWMSIQTPQRWAFDVLSKNSLLWIMRNLPELRDPMRLPNLWHRITTSAAALDYYLSSRVHAQYCVRALGPHHPTAGRHIVRSLEEIAWQTN